MLRRLATTAVAILCGLAATSCGSRVGTDAVGGHDFRRLSPDSCVPLAGSKVPVTLDAAWQPYFSATRSCPLAKQSEAKPDVVLISVFKEDYYRGKPAHSRWEDFPDPILVNAKGEQVGELEESFPHGNITEMVLTYGRWTENIPGEIRMHIINPAVSGDYDLPALSWSREKRRYVPQDKPDTNGFQMLAPYNCTPLVSSNLDATLGADWKPFLSATRVCPLDSIRGAPPDIVLVTIFPGDYYRDKTAGTRNSSPPNPILLNRKGERVGELPKLFPREDGLEMLLTYGRWQENIPGEIDMRVFLPEAGGGYDLPTLLWDKERQRYLERDR